MLRKIPLTTALLALFAAGVLLGAACGDDDDDAGAQDGDTAAVQEQAEKAMLLAAMNGLDAIGLHEIDEELQTASEIPEGTAGAVTRAHQITAGTDWPDELADGAAELETWLETFETAIDEDDLAGAKEAATETHAAWHELDHDALAFYAGEDHGDDGHSDGEGDDHGEDAEATPGS